ncbi:2,3-bisphosphoglycerate-independent phosphoglycerate mutase [Chitinophaga sp. XS-30]|uniref:2,3-bisphosphoglycerate-independent phosphoglycerate mutase n=1 Tax=Chitinophaga sp. XS-30 TaxID=2604421 RepID=UPI0011DE14FD|nr:2,3-bisphosphoglycerate-independent phosphoglycerate mutase [Chitinophaga sp. XS-30]QEH40325.1 2,3-bisphosphoglycerate-independent phosphoglycerate mutase [Chitinophaga sp. XS-30]
MENKRAILIIMDGWGQGLVPAADAIASANTPFVDSLYHQYPHATLVTCGEEVGLPEGQMGNSEVGHLNIGAGRIVYQELQRINVAIRTGELAANTALLASMDYAKANDKAFHLIGLVSDGGVHSHINHLKALISIAHQRGLQKVFVHAFTDGRDTDPKGGLAYIEDLQLHMQQTTGRIASVTGRYYAMDRDKRWERVKLAYDAMVHGTGTPTKDIPMAIKASYAEGVTDEFIKPVIAVNDQGLPIATINEGDAVLCFNFRTDRCREITEALTQEAFPEAGMQPLALHYTTMTEYDKSFRGVHVIFTNDNLVMTMGEVLEKNGKTQIRIAETEKYPHVSFFFSGGRETPFVGEKRLLAPSPKVATYDLKPEMSAPELTDMIIPELEQKTADFVVLNFANADMVGHTGIWPAAIKAVETVDACVARVVTTALLNNYVVFLTADHGNADYMVNEDGTPNTAHTLNLVPFFIISADFRGPVKNGKLGDLAPTILHFMGLPIPKEMTGNVLV